MFPKRIALPRPPRPKGLERTDVIHDEHNNAFIIRPPQPEGLGRKDAPELPPQKRLDRLLRKRNELSRELGALEAEAERLAFESICGSVDNSQHVENYDGTLGVTRAFVDTYEVPVGQLQWLDDLVACFDGPGESAGDVAGARWGSGCMVSDDLYITAGHCFDKDGGGWARPERNGQTIEPEEIATLMRVNFKYQINGGNNQVRAGDSFPVVELIEYRLRGLDYAIARLGVNAEGVLPGVKYGRIQVAAQDLTEDDAILCVIQHPNGSPKMVKAGPMRDNQGGRITYDSIDSLGGSSGAPVLSLAGELVGVHTNGGCSAFSGFNYGVAIGAIREASDNLSESGENQQKGRRQSYPTRGRSMTKFTGEEFVKALTSEHGILSSGAPLALTGMVKASTGGGAESVLFAPGGTCQSWTPVPIKMILSVEHMGRVPCRDHEHEFVRLHLKTPDTDEGRTLAGLLRQVQGSAAQVDGVDTLERWPPRLPPINVPPIIIPNPFSNVRCAQCIAANLALATAMGAAIAATGLAGGPLIAWIVNTYGVSAAVAGAAAGGISGTALAAVMCQDVC